VSYDAQAQLTRDPTFTGRCDSAAVQQAGTFADGTPDVVALSDGVLRGDPALLAAFVRLDAAGPGIADKVEAGDGIDQALVLDADLLSLTQANWPIIAGLYFDAEGKRIW
jgi:hypothetical protein